MIVAGGLTMRTWTALGAFAVVLSSVIARADETPAPAPSGSVAPGACTAAPDRKHAGKALANLQALVKAASAPLPPKEDLSTVLTIPAAVREGVAMLRCDEPAMPEKAQKVARDFEAGSLQWADSEDRLLDGEQKIRESIVVPLCEATWGRDNAKADLAHEKANPSGVVDLVRLHADGEAIQYWQSQIDALAPQYAAYRHHALTSWQAEGACVVDASKPDGS